MSRKPHRTPPRSQVIGAFVVEAITGHAMTWNQYSERVVAHYHATVDVLDRVVEFHVPTTAENFEHCTRLNTQTVRRLLTGEIRQPVDIEESLLAGLDDDDRQQLQTRLLQRSGLIYAAQPGQGSEGGLVAPCELMRRAADAVQRVAPMLADGRICPKDAPHFATALDALHRVMGACIAVTTQIAIASGRAGQGADATADARAVH